MTRDARIAHRAFVAVVVSAAVVLGVFVGLLLVSADWQWPAAPTTTTADVGSVLYQDADGRPLDPSNPQDARLIAGLPDALRHVGRGEMLFGAFIDVSNAGNASERAARRIELRDVRNRTYRPLPLPASNPFAYHVGTVRGTLPRPDTPAAADLAAGGYLLVFRIPTASYQDGPLELVIHPADGGPAGDLTV